MRQLVTALVATAGALVPAAAAGALGSAPDALDRATAHSHGVRVAHAVAGSRLPRDTAAHESFPCDEDDDGACGHPPVVSSRSRQVGGDTPLAKAEYGHTGCRAERSWLALLCVKDPSGPSSTAR